MSLMGGGGEFLGMVAHGCGPHTRRGGRLMTLHSGFVLGCTRPVSARKNKNKNANRTEILKVESNGR